MYKLKILHCKSCGSPFTSSKHSSTRIPLYCTKECYWESLKKYKYCLYCKNKFYNYKNRKFCNKHCMVDYISKNKPDPKVRNSIYRQNRRNNIKKPIDNIYLEVLIVAQRYKCFYCTDDLHGYKAIEHLQPVSKGGDNDFYNIVYSCKSCNSSKRDMSLAEYAIKIRKLWLLDKADMLMISTLELKKKWKKQNYL